MAKLVGPLMSLEARGKLGDALVYFPFKGRNVVRAWTIPTNPRDIDQKLIRQKIGSLGKFVSKIIRVTSVIVNGSKMYQLVKADTPATQIWNAWLVKKAIDDLKTDANFTALSAAIAACSDTEPQWQCAATELGLETLTGPAFATAMSPEIQLAMGAYAAYKMELSSVTDIYSTYPSAWTTDMIQHFQEDCQTDA